MRRADKSDIEKYLRYSNFIRECRDKLYPPDTVLHKHHIVPKHVWSDKSISVNDLSNIVYLSVDDHVTAHLLYAAAYEEDTFEYIMNMRSARILNKKSIRSREQLDEISKTYIGNKNPFFGKRHTKKTRESLSKMTSDVLTNLSYRERYGDRSETEKQKRRAGVKRSWKNMSEDDRKIRRENISKSLLGKMTGGKNPFATPVIVDGNYYGSISDAKRVLGVSSFILKKYHNIIKLDGRTK